MIDNAHHPDTADHHEGTSSSIVSLREKVGPIQRLLTGIAVSDHAGRGLRRIETARVDAEVKIAETAIGLETTKICSALTARAMPTIGSIATLLNTATAAVDASLSSATAADVVGHIRTRARNRDEIHDLQRGGQLTPDEAQILDDHLNHDMATDINRSRERMHEAKSTVSHLHSRALSGIESAKSAVKSL